MKIIVFDTETTGLPLRKNLDAILSHGNWPDLVSICWHVYKEGHIKKEYYVIRPNGWIITEESTNIHGIRHEVAMAHGVSLDYVLGLFKSDCEDADLLVAHNLHFDKNVLFHAYKWRLGIDPVPFWKNEFCTADRSKGELRLPFAHGSGYKYPRLDELYRDTFKKDAPIGAHNASRDVEVLAEIVKARWALF